MHRSSLVRMRQFVNFYCMNHEHEEKIRVLDVGSYDVNGSYKGLFPKDKFEYTGLDMVEGPNVDIVPLDVYNWDNIDDESFDIIVSGQAFEHIEYPWLTIVEMRKKLKNDGLLCIIAPNGLGEHRYPVDCWRFYSDGMVALAKWANLVVVEVSVGGVPDIMSPLEFDDAWNDACLVACKSQEEKKKYKSKMFLCERRYNKLEQLTNETYFLNEWFKNRNKYNYLIEKYLQEEKIKNIYVFGNGLITDLFIAFILKLGITYTIYDNVDQVKLKDDDVCIITKIDNYRYIGRVLKRVNWNSKITYIDEIIYRLDKSQTKIEIEKYFKNCDGLYIYGAGENGNIIAKILDNNDIKFDGFVVTDYKDENLDTNKKIYNASDIDKKSGIIVSPKDNTEIYKTLDELGIKKVVDGLKLIKIFNDEIIY